MGLGLQNDSPHSHCQSSSTGTTATRKLHRICPAATTMDGASASAPDAKKLTTVFVAGSTGKTGKRVVEKLLERGFGVVAGTTDVDRARGSLPQDPNLQLVSSSPLQYLLHSCSSVSSRVVRCMCRLNCR